MSDAKELVERLRSWSEPTTLYYFDGNRFVRSETVIPVTSEAADWIERWAPVEEKARHARRAAMDWISDRRNKAAKLRSMQTNNELLDALDAALGEDKP